MNTLLTDIFFHVFNILSNKFHSASIYCSSVFRVSSERLGHIDCFLSSIRLQYSWGHMSHMTSCSYINIKWMLAHSKDVCTNTHVHPDLQACMESIAVNLQLSSMWRGWYLDRVFDVKMMRVFWKRKEEHKGSGPGSDLHRRISEHFSHLWFNLFIRCLHWEYTMI